MPEGRLYPLAQWFHVSGSRQKLINDGYYIDRESIRVSDGKVVVFCRDKRIEVPHDSLYLVAIPLFLVPLDHHQWVSASELTSRMVWYIGTADGVTCVTLRFENIKRRLSLLGTNSDGLLGIRRETGPLALSTKD